MSLENARAYLEKCGISDRIMEFNVSSATVLLAAEAIGCKPAHIAKSLTFNVAGSPVMIIAAGDRKVDNAKFKAFFGTKASMLKADEVKLLIGHAVGGVCPFGVKDGVNIYLDESLKRFDAVYPAAGSSNSCIKMTVDELFRFSNAREYIDVTKPIEDAAS